MIRRVAILILILSVVATGAFAPLAAAQEDDDGASAVSSSLPAELVIYQPHYIESGVGVENDGEIPTYSADGRVLELAPTNFDPGDVIGVRVEEGIGSINFDERKQIFRLDTNGKAGTFTVVFTVRETVTENRVVENGTETTTVNETKTRTYAARISIGKTDLSHLPTSQIEGLRNDAENYSEVEGLYRSVGGDAPIEAKLQLGANLVDAIHAPWRALSGDISATITILLTTPGGLIVFALLLAPGFIIGRKVRREVKELRGKIGDHEEIDDALDDVFSEKRKRFLREIPLNDWFDDRTASWLRRNVAPNPWAATREILFMLSPRHMKDLVVSAMIDSGRYALVVERDPVTDGGDGEAGGSSTVLSTRFVDVTDGVDPKTAAGESVIDDVETYTALDDRDVVLDAIDPLDTDSEVLLSEDVDVTSIRLPVANTGADDDLVEKLNVSIPEDFETREHFAEVITTLIVKVSTTDFADEHGRIRPDHDLANLLMSFASMGGEAYGSPYLTWVRDLMIYNLEQLDAAERIEAVVSDMRDDGSDRNE